MSKCHISKTKPWTSNPSPEMMSAGEHYPTGPFLCKSETKAILTPEKFHEKNRKGGPLRFLPFLVEKCPAHFGTFLDCLDD